MTVAAAAPSKKPMIMFFKTGLPSMRFERDRVASGVLAAHSR
jgi:hypothetical protein